VQSAPTSSEHSASIYSTAPNTSNQDEKKKNTWGKDEEEEEEEKERY